MRSNQEFGSTHNFTNVIKSLLCSLAIHIGVIQFHWGGQAIFQEIPGGSETLWVQPRALTIRLAPNKAVLVQQMELSVEGALHKPYREKASTPKQAARTTESPQDANATNPDGIISRQPAPIDPIDLNLPEIDEVASAGEFELTAWIGIDGRVVEVTTITKSDSARDFLDRIATQIRQIRFTPGEENGKPVRAKWHIIVISEPNNAP